MAINKNTFVILITGILYNKQGCVLLIKRSNNNKNYKGFWQTPEGKMEIGEQPQQTLSRELKEELNCRLIDSKLILVNSTLVSLKNRNYHLLRIIFGVTWKGKITLSTEHDDYQWIDIKSAIKMSNLVNGTKEILENINNLKKEKHDI